MPGSPRIGPIEITGLDGPISTSSALASAASTAGLGGAASIPRSSTPSTGGSARSTIMYSWNGSARPAAVIHVVTGSSLIGSTGVSTPIAVTTAACASVSGSPARSRAVRSRHMARSRSPSWNQVSTPAPRSASITADVSPRRPQPRSSISPASQ